MLVEKQALKYLLGNKGKTFIQSTFKVLTYGLIVFSS